VIIDEDNQSMEVIVNDEYLSIAIGKGGQNVSLACEITGWHLEVTSEEDYSREVKQGYDSLMQLSNVGLAMAELLFKSGYASLHDISEASIEDIVSAMEVTEQEAMDTINEAKQLISEEDTQTQNDDPKDLPEDESEDVPEDAPEDELQESANEESTPVEQDQDSGSVHENSDPENKDGGSL
jgi:N utilization substance protein A